jgi:hypothetical protein
MRDPRLNEQDGYFARRERMRTVGAVMLLRAIFDEEENEASTERGRILEMPRAVPATMPVRIREAAIR